MRWLREFESDTIAASNDKHTLPQLRYAEISSEQSLPLRVIAKFAERSQQLTKRCMMRLVGKCLDILEHECLRPCLGDYTYIFFEK